jgi:ADP-ribosylglycohydrolase
MVSALDRSIACLKGLAVGDAIGKQTETLTREKVQQWYPGGIRGFHSKPSDVIPRYVGRRYEWRVGETTDDTEQALAIAHTLIRDGNLSHSRVGRALMQCRKSNHPDVSLGRFQLRGDPDFVCSVGDGCGASMRIAPVGLAYPWSNMSRLTEAVFQSCIPTHGGQFGICAAASVAAAVSAAIDGATPKEVLDVALDAARETERLRPSGPTGNMAAILAEMYARLATSRQKLPERLQADDCFPNKPGVIVPLAISLALITQSASETILLAANIGGDTDSVAAIGGALAAAMFPATLDEEWYETVEELNNHNLRDVAAQLAAMREVNFLQYPSASTS